MIPPKKFVLRMKNKAFIVYPLKTLMNGKQFFAQNMQFVQYEYDKL